VTSEITEKVKTEKALAAYLKWERCSHKPSVRAAFEGGYWAGLAAARYNQPVALDEVKASWWDEAIRAHCAEHGPSGSAWNVSMILERLHRAEITRLTSSIGG
jgi:hypothetical protein